MRAVAAAVAVGGDALSFFGNPILRDVGAGVVLTGVVIMILTGRLVPISTHRRELEAAEKRTADAVERGNEWKATAAETAEVNATVRNQNSELIEANKVVKALLQASGPSIADTHQPSGGV
ncbi:MULTISPECIES: hypothetical protein [unclassified Microbacterium]|uniref:hypothetical protein n=1 Tax=unclassified Microbacterium TaxID=2609290 RepID=UPI00386525A3